MKVHQEIACLFFCLLIFLGRTTAQSPNMLKQSPNITALRAMKTAVNMPVSVVVTDVLAFKIFLAKHLPTAIVSFEYPLARVVVVVATEENWLDTISQYRLVQFIDGSHKPIFEELKVPGHNLSVNRINTSHADFPNISGKNITISLKENAFDGNDIDFKGRFVVNARSLKTMTAHANIMATLAGGAGNSSAVGRGVAYGSRLLSSGFNNLFPEPVAYFDSLNITVQNHSYGTALENYYGPEAFAYDKLMEARPSTLLLFSAGNSGTQAASSGAYANLPTFANLTGNFKMAKNALVVGSVDSFGVSDVFSSRGPAYDGRLKPDLVSFSPDGTSGATALVSGSAALVQQAIKEKQAVAQVPSALVKAILLNSADDAGALGIDFVTGFGNLNTRRALETVENQQFMEGKVTNANTWTTALTIPQNTAQLKLTLAWLDSSLMPTNGRALTQDIDVEIENTQTGVIFRPWVLNPSPHLDSLKQLPTRKRDTLNNVEQVTIDLPSSGNYTVRVMGTKLTAPQTFYIAYQLDTMHHFKWTFPKTTDNILANNTAVLRWETTLKAAKMVLKYKNTEGGTWTTIDSFSTNKPYQIWRVPDALETGQLLMDMDGQTFVSDTFFISKKMDLTVAFNCADSVGLSWTKLPNVLDYQLFTLGENYLESIRIVQDTFVVIQKKDVKSPYFTVAPVLKKHILGIKPPTPDYAQQGVGCYISTFFAELKTDKTISLNLSIGTTYNLKKLVFERRDNNGIFKPLTEFPADKLVYEVTNILPQNGRNVFRVRFETQRDNAAFVSDETFVFFLDNQDYSVFPNPTLPNTPLSILAKKQEENVIFRLFDTFGRLVLQTKLIETKTDMPLPIDLAKGFYVYRIEKEGKGIMSGRLLIVE